MANAFVTLATNDIYALGALILGHSLLATETKAKLVVMVTDEVSTIMSNRLRAVYNEIVSIEEIDSKDEQALALLKRPELGVTFSKIHLWKLTQYEKVVFLDSDVLVLKSMDDLFNYSDFSAAPDSGWPDCFNSGVFVTKPSQETFHGLTNFAQKEGSFDGGDQGLLNDYFKNWNRIPFLYNVTPSAFYSYAPAYKRFSDEIKAVHFIGNRKPWHSRIALDNAMQEMFDKWWQIHDTKFQDEPTPGLYATSQPIGYPTESAAPPQGQVVIGVDPKTLLPDRLAHMANFINYRVAWSDSELPEESLTGQQEQVTQTRKFSSTAEFRQAVLEEMRQVNVQLEQLRLEAKKNEKIIEKLQERNSDLADVLNHIK